MRHQVSSQAETSSRLLEGCGDVSRVHRAPPSPPFPSLTLSFRRQVRLTIPHVKHSRTFLHSTFSPPHPAFPRLSSRLTLIMAARPCSLTSSTGELGLP